MRHLMLLTLLFAVPCFAASPPMPDVPTDQHSICQLKHCECPSFELAQLPDLGPSSMACVCGHSLAVHGEQAHNSSGLTHAIGSSAFTTEEPMSFRAKCRITGLHTINSAHPKADGTTPIERVDVTLQPVFAGADHDANAAWSKYTPSGELRLSITNPAVFPELRNGRAFFVDFTPIDFSEGEKAAG